MMVEKQCSVTPTLKNFCGSPDTEPPSSLSPSKETSRCMSTSD
jgi:hypothetical protein